MRGRVRTLYFVTSGRKLEELEQLPAIVKELIDTKHPQYREPPPVHDDRPNEISWTYFNKVLREKGE
jgi:hypothetical protein